MHEQGESFLKIPAAETFPGSSLARQAERIKRLVQLTGAQVILDYGSGKGRQYDPQTMHDGKNGKRQSIIDYWDVEEVVCYDPAYAPYSKLPEGKFHGVISTDVLEHCPEEDIPWIIAEIFGYAERFVFANVACYPARKRLPTGENAHCTIKPAHWWRELVEGIAGRHPGLRWEFWIQSQVEGPQDRTLVEQKVGNA
jgi:hypothetical protein